MGEIIGPRDLRFSKRNPDNQVNVMFDNLFASS